MDWRSIPSKIRINGAYWRVEFVPGLKLNGGLAYGVCLYKARVIELNTYLKRRPKLLAETWVHELLHAHMPLTRKAGRPRMDVREEETLVLKLEKIAKILIPRAKRRRA